MVKRDTLKKSFLKIKLHLQLLFKVPYSTIPLCSTVFSTTLLENEQKQHFRTFDQYLINSMNNMHVNFLHWISLHPKKAITTFSGHTLNFLGENHKTRTNNLHHLKYGSVAVVLSLKVWFRHVQKLVQ